MPRLRLTVLLLLTCACADTTSTPRATEMEDGVYEVLDVQEKRAALSPPSPDTRILIHDRRYVRGGAEVPPAYVLLRVAGRVPLDLESAPTQGEADGRPALLLTLTPEAGAALTELTSHANHAAVVVGGDVVTVHRVRVPIEGGHLQISC